MLTLLVTPVVYSLPDDPAGWRERRKGSGPSSPGRGGGLNKVTMKTIGLIGGMSLLIGQEDVAVPVFDTTTLHATAAVALALDT